MKLKSEYRTTIIIILALAIIFRIILIFINPISMFADAIMRYIPQSQQILNLDFNFHDLPLFVLILGFWRLIFSGQMLHLAWKSVSFVFFLGILFLLPRLFKRFELNNLERIIVMALFFFSTWSLLLSTTIMQDMILTFFTISLFLLIEKYTKKPRKKIFFLLILFSLLICLTKVTAYLILFSFALFIILKKENINKKIKTVRPIIIGGVLSLFWPIKNYIISGRPFVAVELNPIIIHSIAEYWSFFVKTYHYFWEFPLAEKVNFVGNLATMFNIYYIGTIIITAIFSILLVISLISYCKKHKEFIGLLLPLFLFALIYWPFIILWSDSDSGRYSFPLWIFLFIFVAKYISHINKKNIRRFFHIIIVLFCILSVVSAFGISLHMNKIDGQVIEISEKLKEGSLENATIISNTEFAAASLNYHLKDYLKNPIQFNMKKNVIDPNIRCGGNKIFESKDFDVFKEDNEYRICRK